MDRDVAAVRGVGGCAGVRLGCGCGQGLVDSVARTGFSAPVFSDFAGKPWERDFAYLLERYYATVGRIGGGWVQSDHIGADGRFGAEGLLLECQREREFRCLGYGISTVQSDGGVPSGETVVGGSGAVGGFHLGDDNGRVDSHDAAVVGSLSVDEFPSDDGSSRPDVGDGSGGDLKSTESEVNEKTLRNREWRREKKERKVRKQRGWRQEVPVVVAEKSKAQKTLEAKWVVENELKAFEAARKLELLKLQDVSEVAKLQERKLKAAGERAMVQIEKSHATLAATGNVPGVVPKGGYCTTIVDDPGLSDGSSPSCTISPDSSASMKEFKETQKKLLDFQKRCEDLQKENLVLKKKYRKEARGALDAGAEIALTWNFDDGPTDSVVEFVKEIPYEVEQDRDIVIGQITLKKDFEAFYADDGCGGEAFDSY